MKMTGARILVETRIEQGVDTVFGYPGGQVLNIYDELYQNSDRLRHVLAAHEQARHTPPTAIQEPPERSVWSSPPAARARPIL